MQSATPGTAMPKAKEIYPHEDLENLAEDLVYQELDRIISSRAIEFCHCNVCIQDIAALTLNRVPSLYCASMADKLNPGPGLLRKVEEVRNMIRDVLPESIEQVSSKTHH